MLPEIRVNVPNSKLFGIDSFCLQHFLCCQPCYLFHLLLGNQSSVAFAYMKECCQTGQDVFAPVLLPQITND